jgi:hypothetical protein
MSDIAVFIEFVKIVGTLSINIIVNHFGIPYFFETKQAISATSIQNSAQSFVHVDCAEPEWKQQKRLFLYLFGIKRR